MVLERVNLSKIIEFINIKFKFKYLVIQSVVVVKCGIYSEGLSINSKVNGNHEITT